MDEIFFLKCIEEDGVLTRVEVKVPKHLATSAQIAVSLRIGSSQWIPEDLKRVFRMSLFFAGRYRLRKDLHLLGGSLKPQQGKEDSNASVQTSFKS